ncbi:calcium/proton exchanger [Jimgerdemannia flammicorona]|uniref:Vacuolar calcium ion transporter n=1 Tax=Jimgerdemannia flammicorona TaxID=994334 RepID=A0A433QU94_9FUNG|nr:calcium/proton exchanger [Jimgerdemannia flammicorona]
MDQTLSMASADDQANSCKPLIKPMSVRSEPRSPMEIHELSDAENGVFADPPNPQTEKRTFKPVSVKDGFMNIAKSSYVNVLIIFVPLGIIAKLVGWSPTVIFVLNFLAIVPLAKLLGYATEDLSIRVGETLGGLLNATFGNAVELIISIIALTKNLIRIVQASMLGSILSNLVFVLGFCFFLGGLKNYEQEFNATAAQTSASLMAIATSSLLLPAAFVASTSGLNVEDSILSISRATAIILLVIYAGYLYFQLRTHSALFVATEKAGNDESEDPQMPLWMVLALLGFVTVLVAVCAEFLVGAIDEIVLQWHLTETFVGLILLPIVGNAAEHVTAVTVSLKNKMDLAIGVAIGSSMQIALLVTPLMVIIGWIIGVKMTLYFNVYETAVMFISVLIVNYLIGDGKSNWLEGLMLLGVYLIISISFFYFPDQAGSGLNGNSTTSAQ